MSIEIENASVDVVTGHGQMAMSASGQFPANSPEYFVELVLKVRQAIAAHGGDFDIRVRN